MATEAGGLRLERVELAAVTHAISYPSFSDLTFVKQATFVIPRKAIIHKCPFMKLTIRSGTNGNNFCSVIWLSI